MGVLGHQPARGLGQTLQRNGPSFEERCEVEHGTDALSMDHLLTPVSGAVERIGYRLQQR